MNLTELQKEFIKDNYANEVDDAINNKIDVDLTYYDEIERKVDKFSNIVECLNGRYTMDDLYSDIYKEYLDEDFEDIAIEVYDEYLDEEEQKEVDNI